MARRARGEKGALELDLVPLEPLPHRFLYVETHAIQLELFGSFIQQRSGFWREPHRDGDLARFPATGFWSFGLARHQD